MKNYRLIVLMALFSSACETNSDPDVLQAQCSYIQQFASYGRVPSREEVVRISATISEDEVRVLSNIKGDDYTAAVALATQLNRRNAFLGELNGSIRNLDPCMVSAERLAVQTRQRWHETEMRNAEESLREMRRGSSITRMP